MSDYGPGSERSYLADLARAHVAGVPLAEVPVAESKDAYVRGDIELEEFERRVAEALDE